MAIREDDAYPVGKELPAEEADTTPEPEAKPETMSKSEAQTEAKKLAGKFNTPEELEAAYQELQSTFGRQGSEVGELRKAVDAMKTEMESSRKQSAPPEKSVDDRYAEIEALLDEGEISVREFSTRSREIDKLARQQEFAQLEQQRQAQEVTKKFREENPLYDELDQSGDLDRLIQQNPLHDKLSAYYAAMAERAMSEREEAVKAAEEAGKQKGMALAKGSDNAKNVISKPGTTQPKKSGPVTEQERRERMMAALKNARGE